MKTCTIIARNYLPWARVLARSFADHHPTSRLTVLLIDDVERQVNQGREPFDVLHLDEIITDTRERHRITLLYDLTELATAVKPLLLRHLLAAGNDEVLYLDPDIWVFAPLDDVSALAEQHSIVLTPHTIEPMRRDGLKPSEADILASGVYNLGFLALGPGCEAFLEWWWERLRRDCVIDHQRMLFTDQRWIDFVPGYFRHHVLRDPTINVAYWNVDRRDLRWTGERYEVGGRPLRFFHFSGFEPAQAYLLSRHQGHLPRVLLSEHPGLAHVCAAYSRRLHDEGWDGAATAPTYGWSRLANGMRVDALTRREYRSALEAWEKEGAPEPPNGFDAGTADAFVAWLNEPVRPGPGPRVSRYLLALWRDRTDLRAAFPDPIRVDAARFLEWVRADGVHQADIPQQLRPSWPGSHSEPAPEYSRSCLPGVNAVGYFRAELGVGEGGRLLVSVLEKAGVAHSTFAYGETASRQGHPFVDRGPRDAPYDVNVLCVNSDRVGAFAHEVGPSFFQGRHTIGLWAWELDEFPPSMHAGFDVVDEVWACSGFTAAAIRRVSPKPVFEFPYPIVPPLVPAGVTRSDLGLPEGRFIFLFIFDFLSVVERKNPFGLIEAFAQAFRPGEGPILLIKAINGHLKLREFERLRAAAAPHPDVFVMNRYLSPGLRTALLSLADCYASLHRAEGFGLTIAEAMALGKPVIATRYSGNLDFMDDGNSFLVDPRMVPIPPGCEPYPVGSMWAEPDAAMASRLMREVVDRPDIAAARGAQAASDIHTFHSPEARAPFVRERLAEIARGRATPPASPQPAPTRGIDKLALHLAAAPGAGAPGTRLRRIARWSVLRATRPFWWGQRFADGAILEALQEAEATRQRDNEAVREEHRAELSTAVEPLQDRAAYLESHLDNVRDDLLRIAAANDAARADLEARLVRLEEESTRAPADRPLLSGGIDYPSEAALLPRRVVELTGWAFTESSPLFRVEIAVDGEMVGLARLGLPRRDVEDIHPVAEAAGAGFSRLIDLSVIPPEVTDPVVSATAITAGGDRLALPPVRTRLAAAPEGIDDGPESGRSPTRVRRPTLVRTGIRSADVRLLAFAHDLGHGGAQAFLLDVVARLRDRPGFSCAVVSPREGPLRARLEAVGVDVHVGPPCPVDRAAGYDNRVDELAGWASTEGFTAVLANTILAFHGIDVAHRAAIPSMWSIHESYARHEFGAVWLGGDMHPDVEWRARHAFSLASLVTFDCDATRRLYLPLGEPSGFVVVPNAVDLARIDSFAADFDRTAARAALGVADNEMVMVCVGSIEPRKGQAILARALKLLTPEYPLARVFLVGDLDGEYSGALKRYATSSGLDERFEVVPYATDVLPWYGVADVSVCPSDNESLPGVVLEAAAMGTPVVASRVFGIPDVIEDGRSGYLCEPSDVGSLANALKRAFESTAEERDAITANARGRVEQTHDAVRRAEHIWDLVNGLSIPKETGSAATA